MQVHDIIGYDNPEENRYFLKNNIKFHIYYSNTSEVQYISLIK